MRYDRIGRVLFIAALSALTGVVGLEGTASAQASTAPDGVVTRGTVTLPLPGSHADEGDDLDGMGVRADPRRRSGARRRVDPRRRASAPRSKAKSGGQVTVPVDVSVGPAFFAFGNPSFGKTMLAGPVYEDQPFHYGLRLGVAAVIDYEFVRNHPKLVPAKYRKMFKPGSEVKITPGALAFLPRDIIISPGGSHTSIYGATWQPVRLGVDLLGSGHTHLNVSAGLLLTYAYINSDAFASPTHFLRPGASAGIKFSTMFNDTAGMSVGWDSNFYIPQDIGGGVFEGGSGDNALWHIGEAFVMLHIRFPYTTSL